MNRTKYLIEANRQHNRNKLQEHRLSSRDLFYDATRGLKYAETDTVKIECNETSREQRLKKWKAQKEFKKKEPDFKKPSFVVRSASKIPSTFSSKPSKLQKTSFTKTKLSSKEEEKPNDQRQLSCKTIPKITTTFIKPAVPSKKSENIIKAPSHKEIPRITSTTFNKPAVTSKKSENILKAPTHKEVPRPNLPPVKMPSVLTSTLKPSRLPEKNKINYSTIPKTTFHKNIPKVYLFGNKNTEKTAIKSKFDKSKPKATDSVNQVPVLSCDISHIESKVDHQKIQDSEDSFTSEIKIRMSTPIKETLNVQKSCKIEERDTLALLEDFSSTVQHSCTSEKDPSILENLNKKTPGTCSKYNKNISLEDKVQLTSVTQSLNDEFEKLKVEEIDEKTCKNDKTQVCNTVTKDFIPQIQTPTSISCIKIFEMDNVTPCRSERLKDKKEVCLLKNVPTPAETVLIDTESFERNTENNGMKDSKSQSRFPTSVFCSRLPESKITPRRSQRLIEKNENVSPLKNLQSVTKPSEMKLVGTEYCKTEKTKTNKAITHSESIAIKSERKNSCEDLLNMPRPSVMGFLDSLDSPPAAATNIGYDFDNLDKEDGIIEKKTDKKLKKVSLLYDPHRRQTRFTSIKGDLMTFSPPE